MTIYRWITTACWLAFFAFWAISAVSAKKTVGRVWRGLGIRAAIALAILVIIFNRLTRVPAKSALVESASPTREAIGAALCVVGLAFAIWARVHLGRNWGMPRSVKENPELVTSGPYRYVRHPIYSGMLLAMIGSALVSGWSWLPFSLVFAVYFIYSALSEQELMLRTFPDSYPAYRQRTKMLIPFVL
jgi:protein-S-isoprenylcysteine O-methyltransferase Ste14